MAQNDNVAHALAGAGGGALSMVVTYPLITLSTRAQTMGKKGKEQLKLMTESEVDLEAQKKTKPKLTIHALEAAKEIIKNEGVAGLYSGLESALFGVSITNFVYYYFYEGTKGFFENAKRVAGKQALLSTSESMITGAVAGAATVVLTNPIWVVNTRMTVKDVEVEEVDDNGKLVKKASPSTIAVLKRIIAKDGVQALFSGILPALVLVINPIIQYTAFEQLRQIIAKRRKPTAMDAFLLGAVGKLLATSITYPYITLKSRMQLSKKDGEKEDGLISGITKILKEEGVSGLYNGILVKLFQSVLTSAFLFYFKEQLFQVAVLVLRIIRGSKKTALKA